MFKQLGTNWLISQPVKGPYSRHDLERSARLYGSILNIPDPFPVNSLAACRAYYWLEASDPALVKPLAKALYRRHFIDNRNLGETEIVIETAASFDINKEPVTAPLHDGDVKARLRGAAEGALEKVVFGAPFFIYSDQRF